MKNIILYSTLCAMMTLVSCEKVTLTDGELNAIEKDGTALLTISTRGVGDSETMSVAESWIYIFNDAGKCITKLTTDDTNTEATAQLKAGTYTLYAVGGTDLSRFNLPIISNATANSLITLVEGKVMDDLVMKTAIQTLADGDNENLVLTLERKVISLDKVELHSAQTVLLPTIKYVLMYFGSRFSAFAIPW